jgi:predicted transcriptional regulator
VSHQRDRIHEHVDAHPGRHFNALTRSLDLAPGQAQYHLRELRRQGRVVEERLYGRTHYYTPAYDARERRAIAVLRRETARDVLFYLLEHGPSSPGTVADDLDIARSTLEWHLDHLTDQDLVAKRRGDHNRVTLAVPQPDEAVRLLEEITPSLSDRMVDRFTRLVDSLLAE